MTNNLRFVEIVSVSAIIVSEGKDIECISWLQSKCSDETFSLARKTL